MSGALGRMPLYVLSRTLLGVSAALVVIASVIMLIDFVELSRTIGGRSELGFEQLFALMLLKSPSTILMLTPFVFLFGTAGAFVTLNRTSELVAMRAAGVSAWRFILPPAAVAFAAGVVAVTALSPFTSTLNARFEAAKAELDEGRARGAGREIWLRQGDANTQIVIRADRQDMVKETIRLRGVSIFIQNTGARPGYAFSRRIEAAEARLMPGYWRLTDVREALPGSDSVRSEELAIPSSLDWRRALETFAAPDAIAFWQLPSTIEQAERAGYSVAGYRLRLQQLLATPLLYAAMTVLAAAFSLRLMRLGGLAALAGAGVAIGFVIFFLNQFCSALGRAEVIPSFVAAWTTPVLALLAGVTLLCYTEDG